MTCKKITSFFMTVVIIIGVAAAFPITSSAATYDKSSLTFSEYLVANFENYESSIDISYYVKSYSGDLERISDKLDDIMYSLPQIFHVNLAGAQLEGTQYVYGDDIVILTKINYIVKKSEYANKKAEFDKAVQEALDYAKSSETDMEKALAVHDYIVLNTEYNKKEADDYLKVKKATDALSYNAYGALVNKKAVCEGYSKAYSYILSLLGVESTVLVSQKMNHAWNYVKVNGKWYHVDSTYDDPLYNGYDMYGAVSHKYFLLSDEAITSLNHYGWTAQGYPKASSKTYDNYFWKNVNTAIIKFNDNFYWIQQDKNTAAKNGNYIYADIKRYNPNTNKISQIFKIASTWFTDANNTSWTDASFSSLVLYNGKFYFNTATQIRCYEPAAKKVRTVYTPKDLNGYIYGMTMNDNILTYTDKTKPIGSNTLKSIAFSVADSTAVTLNKSSASVKAGATTTLKGTLAPAQSTDYIYWTTSNPGVASVVNGVVTGKKAGSCTITAYTETGATATCKITVTA